MRKPDAYIPRTGINSKMGIKSSLGKLRSVVSLCYLFYLASNRNDFIEYSESKDESSIVIKEAYRNYISKYLSNNVESALSDNPLITSQIEALYVGITLMFGFGEIKFSNPELAMSAERKGGKRYPKVIHFANNMVMLDLILSGYSEVQRKDFLKSWLLNETLDNELEKRIATFINICIENNLFKLRNGNDDLIFQTEGIYTGLLKDNEVSLSTDEEVGPFRILKSMLREKLVPGLSLKNDILSKDDNNAVNIASLSKILTTSLNIRDIKNESLDKVSTKKTIIVNNTITFPYLLALRTKPFLLLAGISGTGKSRIVREFAFKSCPKYLQDKDGTTPGNYCMIEVKPNWHDSTELLGYYSNLSKEYQFKKFVKFLVKAKMYPNVPFFVCLDEMNLAPVEQYFAEILSILETRKHPRVPETKEVDMNTIKTEVIVEAKYFQQLGTMSIFKDKETGEPLKQKLTDREIYMKLYGLSEVSGIDEEVGKKTELTTLGLTLPGNVLIIGTVNMDDTTHQFSRKVIDRAMTIEMNGGNLSAMFGGSKNLEYLEDEAEQQKWQRAFIQRYVSADEVLEAHPQEAEHIMNELPDRLNEINKALKGTPFEVSYRVLNELTIMVGVLLDDNEEGKLLDEIIDQAVNNIMLMKILPRIEGDADMFALKNKDGQNKNRLEWLRDIAPDVTENAEDGKERQQTAREKIQEMIDRLDNQEFTRFWP